MRTLRNENDRNEILSRVERLTGTETPAWGKMNVNQMVSHLIQANELPFVASVPDRSNFLARTIIKPLVLYVLPMPKEVKTSPQMSQLEDGRKPMEFAADKATLTDSINKLGNLPLDEKCLDHPFFGKMNAKQWATIAHKHIDHHLKQFGV